MAFKSFFNWSGGKDSALALHYILKDSRFSIEKLLTNVNSEHERVSMHGVRVALLEQQAAAIKIPLQKLVLPDQPSMYTYEECMIHTLNQLKGENYTHSIFGDIFLEDLKAYREAQLAKVEMSAVFPLWKRDTKELMYEFIGLGFKTIVVCVKSDLLDAGFAGQIIDKKFIEDLPPNVDPCGENGEFHTFVFDGPIFNKPIPFEIGERVFREYKAPTNLDDNCFTTDPQPSASMGFWFCDLLPLE